jgi:sulfite reductase (NADPH) hemoprotein beta-component
MNDQPIRKLSRNEEIKAASNLLRGTIAEGLELPITGSIAEDDTQVTKFHGIYQQDDRDLRAERGRKKMEKAFSFMARVRIPGGVMTPSQWLAMDSIGTERANGTLRLTTRQTIQFHGIIKTNLRPAIRAISDSLLDTIAACGDVNRNVICAANPQESALHAEVFELSKAVSAHLLPRTRAWYELWLDEQKIAGGEQEEEPIYGRTYMPRKFKIAIAVPPRNDVDVFAHDLGYIAIVEDGALVGYNVAVGGGMGMTHGEPETFPRTGDIIGFCRPGQAVDVAEKVVTVQRDFGDRSDRKQARLKYTIERIGLGRFRDEVEARLGYKLAPARPAVLTATGDALGWRQGENGDWHYTLFIENGRVADLPARRLLSGLRAIAQVHGGDMIITANQNLVISHVTSAAKPGIENLLAEFGLAGSVGALRRNAMACVALPTCGLALAESERYLPDLVGDLETLLGQAGLAEDEVTIRMTGCPNGCARPFLAEIGLVGRTPGVYHLYLGGSFNGDRLNKLYRRDVNHDGIVAALGPLFQEYAAGRASGERFSDFVIRAGHVKPTTGGARFHADLSPELEA